LTAPPPGWCGSTTAQKSTGHTRWWPVTAGIRVQAIATPGHTPGSTSFLVNDSVLFTGDTLVLQDGLVRPFYRLFNMDTAAQRDSIRKLARLEEVALLCNAHTGCTSKYARAMKHHHSLEAPF